MCIKFVLQFVQSLILGCNAKVVNLGVGVGSFYLNHNNVSCNERIYTTCDHLLTLDLIVS